MNEVIEEALSLIERELLKDRVTVRLEFDRDVQPVAGDRIQLQQVVINLVVNASQASTLSQEQPRSILVRSVQADDGGVEVSIVDQGAGIDPRHVDSLFNAFFTTKPDGIGMGLSICRSIIEAHHGRIWGTNNPDRGMTFGFWLG